MKKSSLALVAVLLLTLTRAAHAQSGCTDSPENPTLILGLVGMAGAGFSTLRARLRSRRK